MFFGYLFICIFIVLMTYFIFKFLFKDKKEKFDCVINKILKVVGITLFILQFFSIFLPDAFNLNYASEDLLLTSEERIFAIVRWLSAINIILPLVMFFNNRTLKNIAVYFCTVTTILSICFFNTYIQYFTSPDGNGLATLPFLSEEAKLFLINYNFRSILIGITWSIQLLLPIIFSVQQKHIFNIKNLKEIGWFFISIIFILINCLPIYVPQHLFGYSNIIFKAWSLPHILWLTFTIIELIMLYYIFRNKDMQTKKLLCLILSICLLFAFNQMFGAKEFSIKKLPLQLCNIASYFILLSLIANSKKLFEFTAIVNVAGVLFALLVPDLENKGLFYMYNMHFIYEHTNILVIPILVILFKIFPRFDKKSLKHAIIGFTIYFASVLLLGTLFNGLVKITGDNIYEANYLFMFDAVVAESVIKGISKLFAINFSIGAFTFYPIIQLTIFLIFTILIILIYFTFKLIYKLNDKYNHKKIPN